MTVTDHDARDSTEFELEGDIDVTNAGAIGDQLCELAVEHPAVVVGCSRVTFVESRGLAMMARVQRFAEESGCVLTWRELPLHVHRTLHVTGLDDYLRIEA
jgi:anti-anti-sigma factor